LTQEVILQIDASRVWYGFQMEEDYADNHSFLDKHDNDLVVDVSGNHLFADKPDNHSLVDCHDKH
jgi:hypothetical protein